MKPKVLVMALVPLAALPPMAQAADTLPTFPEMANQWGQAAVYTVTPYCQVMSNGMRVCQPVLRPAPAPGTPGSEAQTPAALAPLAPQAAPGTAHPYLPNPYLMPNPYLAPYAPAAGYVPPAMMAQPTPAQFPFPQFVAPQPVATAPVATPPVATAPVVTPAVTTPAAEPVPVAAPAVAAKPAAEPGPAGTTAPTPAAPAPQPQAAGKPAAKPAATVAVDDDMVIVHFDYDSAELDNSGRLVLDSWLLLAPKDKTVRITGHADRLGSDAYNMLLSSRRAEAVKRYLTDKGMKAAQMKVVAKGEKVPLVHCKGGATPATKACLAPNRRVEVDPQ
jgi:OOP family OmpA-OmpF porin